MMFQSTPPVWEATLTTRLSGVISMSFNPRLPCGRRHAFTAVLAPRIDVSIHASRVGGDLAERVGLLNLDLFQSTPPVWEATLHHHRNVRSYHCFNPRLPCGRRLLMTWGTKLKSMFQSTPPVWEATTDMSPVSGRVSVFQSTPPVWEATCRAARYHREWYVFQSTPPVWEATAKMVGLRHHQPCFNPRLPCGRRLQDIGISRGGAMFQSTPPVWEATALCSHDEPRSYCFNPRLPCGRRRDARRRGRWVASFNPRLPCGRRPRRVHHNLPGKRFNPRLPCGRRRELID